MWELEERHLQEKHQLFKQQLKDQYFMQRHQLLKRHEKVWARWGEELSSNSFTHLNFFCNSSDFRITLICYFTVKNSLKIRVQHLKKKKQKKTKLLWKLCLMPCVMYRKWSRCSATTNVWSRRWRTSRHRREPDCPRFSAARPRHAWPCSRRASASLEQPSLLSRRGRRSNRWWKYGMECARN